MNASPFLSHVIGAITLVCLLAMGGCGGNDTGAGGSSGSTGTAGSGGSSGAKPAAPTMLKAEILAGGVHLSWKDNSTDEEMFMLMRKEMAAAGDFAPLTMVAKDIAQYHDSTVLKGKTYVYMVHGMKGSAASDPSNEVSILVP